jgi:hypothetical protein
MMVFDEWQNGILISFIVIGIARENNLHHVLHALSQHLLEGWMPNAIIVDNAQAKIFFFRYVDLLIEHVFHDGNAVCMSIGTSFQNVFSGLIEILQISFCIDHPNCEQHLLPSIFSSMFHFN